MSRAGVIAAARRELGYTEQPMNSNRTKYGAAYGLDGQPWCVMFLWWVFQAAGEQKAFYGGGKTASCGELLRFCRKAGQVVSVDRVQAGDILILNFSGTGDTEHCALVLHTEADGIQTIEGNTSCSGSQSNGGMVAEKKRYPSQVVAVCRPAYQAETDYENHWAAQAIQTVKAAGLMEGDPDGRFRPDDAVTRGELAAVLARLEERT